MTPESRCSSKLDSLSRPSIAAIFTGQDFGAGFSLLEGHRLRRPNLNPDLRRVDTCPDEQSDRDTFPLHMSNTQHGLIVKIHEHVAGVGWTNEDVLPE